MQPNADNTLLDMRDVAFTWKAKSRFSVYIENFTIPKGQSIFLQGASGSGKSTLLGLITGMNSPDTGQIHVAGVDITQLKSSEKDKFRADNIGIIFQQLNLIPFSSPLANIKLASAFKSFKKNTDADIFALTRSINLDDDLIINERASELSIGQQQRIAVAPALIGNTAIIIADEPTSALDEDAQNIFIDLLFNQVEKIGASLLMVSHDARLAGRFHQAINIADICKTRRS